MFLVCKLWRRVVLRQWKNIANMKIESYLDIGKPESFKSSVVVPAVDAKKMLRRAAECVNNLQVFTSIPHNREGCVITFQRPFGYEVKNLNAKDAVQFFAENATELTKVEFIKLSETKCIEKLLERNKIKSVEVYDSVDFWRNSSTDGIEILDIGFELGYEGKYNFQSFEGVSFSFLYNMICFKSKFMIHIKLWCFYSTFKTCKLCDFNWTPNGFVMLKKFYPRHWHTFVESSHCV